MSDDLVTRLREAQKAFERAGEIGENGATLMREAAAAIERLQEVLTRTERIERLACFVEDELNQRDFLISGRAILQDWPRSGGWIGQARPVRTGGPTPVARDYIVPITPDRESD